MLKINYSLVHLIPKDQYTCPVLLVICLDFIFLFKFVFLGVGPSDMTRYGDVKEVNLAMEFLYVTIRLFFSCCVKMFVRFFFYSR